MKIKAQIDRMVGENNRIKAYASVILGGEYVVRDIAVMDSKNGLFARMPYRSYKDRNGDMKYSDTVFAMNETSRTPSTTLSLPHTSSVCTWSRMRLRIWRNLSTKAPAWCSRCSLHKKVSILAGLSALHRYPCRQR